MKEHEHKWKPPPEVVERMVRMRDAGATYVQIAAAVGENKDRVVLWLLLNTGKKMGIREGGRFGRDAVHQRCGIYFDCACMAKELEENGGENDA